MSQESKSGLWGRMLEGSFGKYLLPGIVAQSVLIGGGYATGREVVQYAARFGAMGWIGVLGVFIGFTVMNIAVFELARTYQTYDYRSLIKQVIWKFWPAFDISYIVLATIIIAIMASATGNIVEQTREIRGYDPRKLRKGLIFHFERKFL